MATQYHESGQLPEGVVLAHTLHGRPDESVTNAHVAAHAGIEVQPAPYDGIPYYGDLLTEPPKPQPVLRVSDRPGEPAVSNRGPERDKRCWAKGDTCMGWAINNSSYCAAHAGVFRNPIGRHAWDDTLPPFEPSVEGDTAEQS